MKKKQKTILIVVAVIIVAVVVAVSVIKVYKYVFRKSDTTGITTKPDYIMPADSLVAFFDKNEDAANKTYYEKIIQVKGAIAEITKDSVNYNIVLRDSNASEGVSCTLGSDQFEKAKSLGTGKIIEIKGICFGKNLIDISLNKCAIIEE
jgi:cytoskeletal protein RodZ